jgi:hypothetical protein
MKRHIPAAITFKDFNAASRERFRRGNDVGGFCISAESDHRRVFVQQKHITDASFFAQGDQLFLQANASPVIDGAELENGNQFKAISPQRHGDTEKAK